MDLEDTMASLRINDGLVVIPDRETGNLDQQGPHLEESRQPVRSPEPRRSKRFKQGFAYMEKRRVLSKPIKIKEANLKPCENYYLDKKTKRLNLNLETIYEDSEDAKETFVVNRKFEKIVSHTAIKSRKFKVKSVSAVERRINKQKIPLKYLHEKLEEIRDD